MKLHLLPIAALILASCSGGAATAISTPQPSPLGTHDVVSTIVAAGPMIEVSFDGTECTISGPSEVPAGGLVTKFTNSTGRIATPWVARSYPGKTWQDVLDWIGTPGSFHDTTPGWLAIPGLDRSVSESETVSYRQYSLTVAAEYNITIEFPTDHFWPCGPFQVVAAP